MLPCDDTIEDLAIIEEIRIVLEVLSAMMLSTSAIRFSFCPEQFMTITKPSTNAVIRFMNK
jgi:hypothetical protein